MAEIIVFSDTNFWVKIPVEGGNPLIFREGVYHFRNGPSSIRDYDVTRWVGPKYVRQRGEQGKDGANAPHDILRPVVPLQPRQHWNAT